MVTRAEQRYARILDLARVSGRVRVTELAAELDVSAMTVRRDLAVLEERGLLDKVYGGGVLRPPTVGVDSRDDAVSQATTWWRHDPNESVPTPEPDRPAGAVGIVVPSSNYYFPAIIRGARRVLDDRGVGSSLAISSYAADREERLVDQMLETGNRGLLLAPSGQNPEGLEWLARLPRPAVLLERTYEPAEDIPTLPSVCTHHTRGCLRATQHLAGLGHRGVALVTHGLTQTGQSVIDGWTRAVDALDMDAALSPLIVQPEVRFWPPDESTQTVLDTLHRAQVTAVIVHSDLGALALLYYARIRGWRIPDDLSIIAYDDEIAEMADPPLTAVAPPKTTLGETAAELLLNLMTGRYTNRAQHILIDPVLDIRRSTTQPRTTHLI